jgi:uroporphyrinogen decarboxylase
LKEFEPDYKNILNAIYRVKPRRVPLYEHTIDISVMEKILGFKFSELYYGNKKERREYFGHYNNFFKMMCYDTVSFECLITSAMPGNGALYFNKEPVIKNLQDFKSYPWKDILHIFFNKYDEDFLFLEEKMLPGMKAIGGPGNGIFECVQDLVGLQNLGLISIDDPELFRNLFNEMGEVHFMIWKEFLEKYSDSYAICRFGDDLGFKTSTLLNPRDIREFIIPQYKKIVELIKKYNKPFLLHSCGNIFNIMDDLINIAGIDAKHSNEDIIAPFSLWLKKYADRISLFGGMDMSFLCVSDTEQIKCYVHDVLEYSLKYPGFAFGTGNSIPAYMPVENYLSMVNFANQYRMTYENT